MQYHTRVNDHRTPLCYRFKNQEKRVSMLCQGRWRRGKGKLHYSLVFLNYVHCKVHNIEQCYTLLNISCFYSEKLFPTNLKTRLSYIYATKLFQLSRSNYNWKNKDRFLKCLLVFTDKHSLHEQEKLCVRSCQNISVNSCTFDIFLVVLILREKRSPSTY